MEAADVGEPSGRDLDKLGSDLDVADAYEPDAAEPLGRNLAADPMDYEKTQRSEPQLDLGLFSGTSDIDSNTCSEPESESQVSGEHSNEAASVNITDLLWYYGLDKEILMVEMAKMEQGT